MKTKLSGSELEAWWRLDFVVHMRKLTGNDWSAEDADGEPITVTAQEMLDDRIEDLRRFRPSATLTNYGSAPVAR